MISRMVISLKFPSIKQEDTADDILLIIINDLWSTHDHIFANKIEQEQECKNRYSLRQHKQLQKNRRIGSYGLEFLLQPLQLEVPTVM